MIESGEKTEEYRDIKPFWIRRLVDWSGYPKESPDDHKYIAENIVYDIEQGHNWMDVLKSYFSKMTQYDAIRFVNGGNFHPSHPSITVLCKGIVMHEGRPEWGAEPGKKYFVIKLGERVDKSIALTAI